MRNILHLGLSALILGFIMLCPAFSQTPPPAREQPRNDDAEIKAAQERLKKLIAEIAAQEAKKSQTPKAEPPKAATPSDPAVAALEKLAKSSDPKVAALAKELLGAMKHSTPGGDGKLLLQFDGAPGGKPGVLEFNIKPPPSAPKPGIPFELKFDDLKFDLQQGVPNIKGQPNIIIVGEAKGGTTPAAGGSTLKMSADGKTAAVVGADGTITIYDVATGKEQMRFPGKK
jgi:hypothetical protein